MSPTSYAVRCPSLRVPSLPFVMFLYARDHVTFVTILAGLCAGPELLFERTNDTRICACSYVNYLGVSIREKGRVIESSTVRFSTCTLYVLALTA